MKDEYTFSLLSVGYDREIHHQLIEWDGVGIINYLGMFDRSVKNKEEKQLFFIGNEGLENKKIDFILICGSKPDLISEAKKFKHLNSLIITLDEFWLIHSMMQQRLELKKLYTDQKLFRTLLMYSHEGVQFCDKDGIIQFVNPSFSRITNIPAEERIGYHVANVSPEGALNKAYQTKTPVLGHKATGIGSLVETISNAAPIFVDGEFSGAVTTFQDITEVQYLSQQLTEINKENEESSSHKGHEAVFTFDDIIGASSCIQEVIELAKKVTRTRSTIMITGESGTGKELFAHAIHSTSPFYDQPFVVVNCASIPADLLESELFGYEKGAFTGAATTKMGKIELAAGGTLFLDEIGTMSLSLQAKLLRVLQYKEFERVGGVKKIKIDFRIIAATNEDLYALVKKNKFREDLYYRLNVISLHVPPLRQRKEDIPLLVEHLMNSISKRIGLNYMQLTNKGVAMVTDYDWPGNIRELENFLERVMNLSITSLIPESLIKENLEKLHGSNEKKTKQTEQSFITYPPTLPLRTLEKEHIRRALEHFGKTLDGKKKAARSLGISISTLYNKVKDYQLE